MADLLSDDVKSAYPALSETAAGIGDRGVKRAITWGEKVTKIQKTLVDRYTAKGDALFEGKELYICEACGFLFVGPAAPTLCPICKAPESRFSKVE